MMITESLPRWVNAELSGIEDQVPTASNGSACAGLFVPLHNERPDGVFFGRFLDSIGAQEGMPDASIETVFHVNNSPRPPRYSPLYDGWKEAYRHNQEMLGYLRSEEVRERLGPAVAEPTIIDGSSRNKAKEESNVGSARQRALAALALRFSVSDSDLRVPIQMTDADSYLKNPNHFTTLCEEYEKDPDLMGMAQRLEFEIYEKDYSLEEWAEFSPHLADLFCVLACRRLLLFMNGMGSQHTTSGPNSSFRLDAAVSSGGFPPIGYKEDGIFGDRLRTYAAEHGGEVRTVKDRAGPAAKLALDLTVVSEFRASARTGNSMWPILNKVRAGRPVSMTLGLTGEEVVFTPDSYRWLREMAETFTGKGGESGKAYRDYAEDYGDVRVITA